MSDGRSRGRALERIRGHPDALPTPASASEMSEDETDDEDGGEAGIETEEEVGIEAGDETEDELRLEGENEGRLGRARRFQVARTGW